MFACPTWCVARSIPPQSRWRWRGVRVWSTHWGTSPARKAEDRSARSTVHCHSPSAWLSTATTNNTGVKVHAAVNITPSLQEYSRRVTRNLCLPVHNVFSPWRQRETTSICGVSTTSQLSHQICESLTGHHGTRSGLLDSQVSSAPVRVHPVHLMNADWAPGGRQPSDQAYRLGLWVRL